MGFETSFIFSAKNKEFFKELEKIASTCLYSLVINNLTYDVINCVLDLPV